MDLVVMSLHCSKHLKSLLVPLQAIPRRPQNDAEFIPYAFQRMLSYSAPYNGGPGGRDTQRMMDWRVAGSHEAVPG